MIETICKTLEETSVATAIRESGWLFPSIETVHVLALTLVMGSIAMCDLRLLNLTLRHKPVGELLAEVLPWTWIAFVVAAIAGTLLFSSAAHKYIAMLPFQLKMVLMALAGLNMLIFHLKPFRTIDQWGHGKTPVFARISGGISLTLWIAIVACGRIIGFV